MRGVGYDWNGMGVGFGGIDLGAIILRIGISGWDHRIGFVFSQHLYAD